MGRSTLQVLRTVILMGRLMLEVVMSLSQNTAVMEPKSGSSSLAVLLMIMRTQLQLRLMAQFTSQASLLVILMGKSIVVRVMPLSQNTVAMVPKYGPNCLGHHLMTSASQSPLVPMVRSTWLVGVLEILTGKPIAVITMDLSRSTGSLIPLTTY